MSSLCHIFFFLVLPPSGELGVLCHSVANLIPTIYSALLMCETNVRRCSSMNSVCAAVLKSKLYGVCLHCRLLELGLEGKVIRSQDLSSLIRMVASNPQGHHLAWNFVKKNWDTLVQKLVPYDGDALNDTMQ